uniref:Uncharacterized protein n=1 Tax=Dipterocladia arabiensis TaxID=2007176 RepID=A0A1Z1M0B8_9FLOR|nr:hypothetical protein [Dipterocladia arabiensis]ARW59300.1 hypothetical protein [Dipterocladia arabiensis]
MIKYWPNTTSIKLNNYVVNLFYITKKKFVYDLSNNTQNYLYTDILNSMHKKKLFNIILREFEKLILDLTELNLGKQKLKQLNYQIFCDFIDNIVYEFIYYINKKYDQYQKTNIKIANNHKNNKILMIKHNLLLDNLLIYLILGSSFIDKHIFIFNKFYTPYQHVQILFENFIIQISHIIINKLFNNFLSLSELIQFLKKYSICNNAYISTRSIILFLNYLRWQNLIYSYIYQPQEIYNAHYQVLIFSNKGIIKKYIYISRVKDLEKLSKFKKIFIFLLEIKDTCIPKIEKFFLILIKYIFYIIINLINNTIILMIRIIMSYLYQQ